MSYQSKEMDGFIDGAVTAAAEGDKAGYDKDVIGMVDTAFTDMPRIPLFQPYVNIAMQKNVSGYQYWFHRRLDYRALAERLRRGEAGADVVIERHGPRPPRLARKLGRCVRKSP